MQRIVMVIAGGAVALFALISWGCRVVNEDQIALQYRWGKMDAEPLEPGFHVLWPGYGLVLFDNTRHHISMDDKDPEEAVIGIGAQTKEKYVVGVVVDLEYKINPKLAVNLLKGYGRQDSTETRKRIEERIKAEVRMAVRHATPEYMMEELINNRDQLRDIIVYQLAPSGAKPSDAIVSHSLGAKPATTAADLGIEVTPLEIAYSVPDEYKAAQLKMTEKALLAANRSYDEEVSRNQEIELANAKRQKDIDGTTADAHAALERSSMLGIVTQKWNGVLPNTVLVGNDTLAYMRQLGFDKQIAPATAKPAGLPQK
jgi:regulator of protease activity HflC (stomatin/prohibitin superfamily)